MNNTYHIACHLILIILYTNIQNHVSQLIFNMLKLVLNYSGCSVIQNFNQEGLSTIRNLCITIKCIYVIKDVIFHCDSVSI